MNPTGIASTIGIVGIAVASSSLCSASIQATGGGSPSRMGSNTARLRIFNSELGLGKRLKGKG
ncbi:hypothetical protein [Nostoc sp. CALU 1950]|uniref:hypothetical protein n=1 Tax=Nostoc sp. CALU 1950 TaxID=3104321 RepID=UPI003EBE20AE